MGPNTTPEFRVNWGLDAINAEDAYDEDLTGSDIRVAVADSGLDVDHSEFDGSLDLNASANYYDPSNDYNVDVAGADSREVDRDNEVDGSGVGHGTHVSGIIGANRDDQGMHGVAPQAEIVPYAVLNDQGAIPGGAFDDIIPNLVEQLNDHNISVVNNSWGGSADLGDYTPSETPLQTAVADAYEKGTITYKVGFVWATGNASKEQPSLDAGVPYFDSYSNLEDYWLAVAALDEDGTIASHSNHCGDAQDWCLAAPGTNVESSIADGTYKELDGTSMAAPHATGAIAILLENNTGMTPKQAIARLLKKADTDFADYDPAVYGQGRLDLRAALAPTGTMVVEAGSNTAGTAPLRRTALHAGPAVGDGLARSMADINLLVRDSYGGTFFPKADIVLNEPASPEAPIAKGSFQMVQVDGDPGSSKKAAGEVTDGQTAVLVGTPRHFTAQPESSRTTTNPLTRNLIADSYAGLLPRAQGLAFWYGEPVLGDNLTVAFFTAQANDRQAGHLGRRNKTIDWAGYGTRLALGWSGDDGARRELRLGVVGEDERLLNSSGHGAAAVTGTTHTVYTGVRGRRPLAGDGWAVHWQGQLGVSRYHGDKASLVGKSTPILTSRAGTSLTGPLDMMTDDRLTIGIVQPLRVEAGALSLNLPDLPKPDGSTEFTKHWAALTPSGREFSLRGQYTWGRAVGAGQMRLGLGLTHEPGHLQSAGWAPGGALGYRLRF